MFDVLQDILIITDSGKVVASKISNKSIEEQLFGMLISALSSFAQGMANGILKNFEFRNLRFDLIRQEGFIFLGSSSRKISHKKALRTIEYVAQLFFKYYPEIHKWDGNVNIFHELEKFINKSRDDYIIEMIFKEQNH